MFKLMIILLKAPQMELQNIQIVSADIWMHSVSFVAMKSLIVEGLVL